MRLDEATPADMENVRVQCLGKDYHATEAAWDCLQEVRELRKEHTKGGKSRNESAEIFNDLEREYVSPSSRNSVVHNILAGFGINDDGPANETPKQRVNRFKADLNEQLYHVAARNTFMIR